MGTRAPKAMSKFLNIFYRRMFLFLCLSIDFNCMFSLYLVNMDSTPHRPPPTSIKSPPSGRAPGKSKTAKQREHDKVFNHAKYLADKEKERIRSQKRRDKKKELKQGLLTRDMQAKFDKEAKQARLVSV